MKGNEGESDTAVYRVSPGVFRLQEEGPGLY
jgi:hypothetical protein